MLKPVHTYIEKKTAVMGAFFSCLVCYYSCLVGSCCCYSIWPLVCRTGRSIVHGSRQLCGALGRRWRRWLERSQRTRRYEYRSSNQSVFSNDRNQSDHHRSRRGAFYDKIDTLNEPMLAQYDNNYIYHEGELYGEL